MLVNLARVHLIYRVWHRILDSDLFLVAHLSRYNSLEIAHRT